MIVLAAAVEEDMERVLEIERACISPPWTHGALLSEVYREDSFFAVARQDNAQLGDAQGGVAGSRIVGFVVLRCAGDECELLQVAVDTAAQRRGVGDALIGAAIAFAAGRLLTAVYLEVRKSNAPAISLYKKHGFTPVRTRKGYYDCPVEDGVVMKLRIES